MAKQKRLTHEDMAALPLHKLLAMGLRDLKKHERTPGCIVYMGTWLNTYKPQQLDPAEPNPPSMCVACVAGSILKHTFSVMDKDADQCITSLPFNDRNALSRWLNAVEHLRCGKVSDALGNLGRRVPRSAVKDRRITRYAVNREKFYAQLTKLQAELKAANI